MNVWLVSVESEGYSGDWIDDVVVIAGTEAEAGELAWESIREDHPELLDLKHVEAYRLRADRSRVVGRLVNSDTPERRRD